MLRKLFTGVLNLSRAEIHPLSSRVFIALVGRFVYLSDGNRFVEYPSFEAALDTRVTRRKLYFGEEL